MSAWLYALAGFLGVEPLAVIYMIGKPRKTITPGAAVLSVIISGFWIAVLVIIAGRIG